MSAVATVVAASTDAPAKMGGKKRLILLAVPVLLAAIGAGLWFSGILPPLLGLGDKSGAHAAAAPAAHGATKPVEGHGVQAKSAEAGARSPVFMELPELIANLNAGPRRTMYIKIHPRLELARAEDEAAVKATMPRLMDLFQTYLREMRPEEMRGSAGTYRLREELLARANIAVAPVRVLDVLFPDLLIQ